MNETQTKRIEEIKGKYKELREILGELKKIYEKSETMLEMKTVIDIARQLDEIDFTRTIID